jgi:uridine kinase
MNIEKLIATKQPKVGDVKFIAIYGHGGSGKSTLAELLSKRLNAQIIHGDDFAGWDNPKNWWPLVIDKVFEPISQGAKTLNYERSKWREDHHPKPAVDEPVTPIMIIEGVGVNRKEFRKYISLSIRVDAPKEVCLQRGFERDRGQDGKSDEEIKHMWEEWYEDELNFFEQDDPARSAADLVIDGTKPFEEQL